MDFVAFELIRKRLPRCLIRKMDDELVIATVFLFDSNASYTSVAQKLLTVAIFDQSYFVMCGHTQRRVHASRQCHPECLENIPNVIGNRM